MPKRKPECACRCVLAREIAAAKVTWKRIGNRLEITVTARPAKKKRRRG